jgi:hypothetical protein
MNDEAPRATTPSERVVRKVADAKGVAPTELDPLSETVDLESMDGLVENSATGVRIECSIEGVRVRIGPDGAVEVSSGGSG